MVRLLQPIVATKVRDHLLRIVLDLRLVITMILTFDIQKATNRRRHNATPKITSSLKNLLAVVVRRLMTTRQMLHLANLALVHRSFPRPPLCLHRRLHVSPRIFRPTASAESHPFLDHRL
jgi:hypothetical protein